ncbi:Adhesin domain-containing protein [Vibrio crassostreae]|uniref:hypothetical protein n=2 Tax=Vibrio crassostreae TaxID=246167 RepID=UPI001B306E7E|nr:hypothetical protein [Vibrio crassostreae]CAK1980777.1 Adhesin domain-containing protein [Vibrio crassostreae]CAK1983224.1 Adhesin domain-containing protein [Vibrio crassostreae]CAK2024391.1 Adhesin domain-containing protein [Vibrio crassostreae]CAK2042264.1 Adhesin domain-containing protein [Vibrio crassostreae]CAK2042658.1 Adhesin domain-containing protein [Vibrio crassostreae]
MKQLQTLSPGESIQFNAGQAGKYLIIREASHSLILRGDALRPTEIGRGDTVDITRFDELELFNHQTGSVTVEYQVADIPIITKAQKIDINNSVAISEILTPITVNKIQEPLKVSAVQAEVKTRIQNDTLTISKVQEPLKVSAIQGEVKARIQNDTLTVEKLPDLYTLQKVDTGLLDLTGDEQSIVGNEERKGLFIQANKENEHPVLVQGFIEVVAGGHVLIKSNQVVMLEGIEGDTVRLGEFV